MEQASSSTQLTVINIVELLDKPLLDTLIAVLAGEHGVARRQLARRLPSTVDTLAGRLGGVEQDDRPPPPGRCGSHRRWQLPSPSAAARPPKFETEVPCSKNSEFRQGVLPTDPRNVMAVENGRNQHPASRSWVLSAPISTLPVSPKPRKCLTFQMFIKKIRPARFF
jgi:hypothetical protein